MSGDPGKFSRTFAQSPREKKRTGRAFLVVRTAYAKALRQEGAGGFGEQRLPAWLEGDWKSGQGN